EQVALDRLAQPGGATRLIRFPARREHERTADRKVRRGRRSRALEGDNVRLRRALDTGRLAIDRFEMIHGVTIPSFFHFAWGPTPPRYLTLTLRRGFTGRSSA